MNTSRQRILVVEDDSALLEGVRDILELAGYEVVTAINGAEGLDWLLANGMPDLIMSDIMMPRMNGHEFYEAVRSHGDWLAVPFIFLTAKGEKNDVRFGKRLGVDDYITKPFEEEDLLVAVGSKLKRRAELRTAHEHEISLLKRSILTTLNHEFRTPLTYVTAYADMLQESGGELSEVQFKDFLRGIQAGSERLRRLVEDFIFLVELEAGEAKRTFDRRRQRLHALGDLIRDVLRRAEPAANARKAVFDVQIPERVPVVMGDADFLRDALGRLVDNACKFSKPEGNQVTIAVEWDPTDMPERWLRIVVSDRGIGIAPEELPRVFDVFYQIDRAKMEQQGSGSGLAIARGIITLHGGKIEIASTLDTGSQFTVFLPLEAWM